jgi:4-deoxy-L-threo-5-hexosulose-uronate ketol-isomerase
MNTRYATSPKEFASFTTEEIRNHFLVEHLFVDDQIIQVYSHYDRLIIGGVKPVSQPVNLNATSELKADYYLQRRELGIINVGETGTVEVDGALYVLKNKEALYIGKDAKDVIFKNSATGTPLFYFNSAPAHTSYPTRLVTLDQAETVETGDASTSNRRTIRKLIVESVVPTCQLQMGLTELHAGSIWNTMPPHTHDRRMEAYFYFNLAPDQVVCHFIGKPDETRHVWVNNHQAVISPPWSIHSGAGTSNYAFIWGMAGENLDYGDMDKILPNELR